MTETTSAEPVPYEAGAAKEALTEDTGSSAGVAGETQNGAQPRKLLKYATLAGH